MINHLTDKIIRERGLNNPMIFRDTDGPGIGNSSVVEYIERPKGGGRNVYFINYKYPYKGLPDDKGVYAIHDVKKIIGYALKAVKNRFVVVMAGLLFLAPNWPFKPLKTAIVDYFYYLIEEYHLYEHLLKPERYCPCVREMHRTFSVLIDRQKDGLLKKILILARDVLCMFFEYDSAYKFRLQDAFSAVKKKLILQNIAKGVDSIFAILISREIDNKTKTGMGSKWQRLRRLAGLVLKIPSVRKLAYDFFSELDFKKMCPDKADWYYDLLRMDYNFGGKTLEKRIQERKKIEGDNWPWFEEAANNFIHDRDNLVKVVEAKFKKGL